VQGGSRRTGARRLRSWVAARWRGEAALAVAFWDDMLIAGSALNLGVTLLSMGLVSLGARNGVAAAVFFAPAPVNVFLAVSVWRSASRSGFLLATAARVVAAAWLVAATVV
jgi:hypothetical protein